MRLFYLSLFTLCSFAVFGQESDNVSIEAEQAFAGLKLYPNPAFGETVQIVSNNQGPKEVTVYDVFGKIVLTEKIYRNSLNISSLNSGIYMLQIRSNHKTVNRKLVVK
ncbi:T9SS type A sorting domain-containing protein [Pseudozobellia thermophila]|uniref:Por secretion system C-terminal sorting domain-containing protein n=1 Tax=Pseudozobellia thermophila TaxID=192903 RepID=A0A1M6AGC2_9FLAO|nr:T9SS type A sorting domain-containing protein [Pseudozobellia thermophila]SHI35461.1 Por secretion system C-terminal sorting domain-containing protein [Pseudozobellia thermophila]